MKYAILLLALLPSVAAAEDLEPYLFTKFAAGLEFPAGSSTGIETVSGLIEIGVDHKSGFGIYASEYIADSRYGTFTVTSVNVSYKFYLPLRKVFK